VPLVAVVLQMQVMAVVVAGALAGQMMAALATAMMATMLAAGERVSRGCECGGSQCKRGNGDGENLGCGVHGFSVS
jgi:biotin transporter BioY